MLWESTCLNSRLCANSNYYPLEGQDFRSNGCWECARVFTKCGREYDLHVYTRQNMVAEDGNWMVCAHLGRALRRLVCSRKRAGSIGWLSHFGFSIRAADVQNIDYTKH